MKKTRHREVKQLAQRPTPSVNDEAESLVLPDSVLLIIIIFYLPSKLTVNFTLAASIFKSRTCENTGKKYYYISFFNA